MSELSTQLPERLGRTKETGLDAILDPGLLVPLLRLLVEGDPVTIEQLATAAGRPVETVRTGLAAVLDTEYDDQGRIIGQGLTLRPTPHRFTVAGQELYTWCALDTLIFPTLLERVVRVESVSPVSGDAIRIMVDPTVGVTIVEPATAVVSLVNPEQITSIRSTFCNQVHFFTSTEDAADWVAERPDAEIVPVAEAYRIGANLTTGFLERLQPDATAAEADDIHCC